MEEECHFETVRIVPWGSHAKSNDEPGLLGRLARAPLRRAYRLPILGDVRAASEPDEAAAPRGGTMNSRQFVEWLRPGLAGR